ncbi:Aro5p SKDI_07G1420 [Saccharomyces kudriavzevii IFO 1802]|uniref:YGL117W-like protein n=2 Tax=Saccharomyces kudriavzevii (strain ATCC MYA-4449 / AS 2.2408 / CBS 8840 / NBRC 1802 / NCYC 2889) TaxID=226230 RepID=J8TGT8_SACK1|nr:uncharacterized protein SKDI_07G1420 [Saccharomyces kudriavzevii IFO 1802]EJT44024.1 YGL117W-like protein [Saccharomyces kudriavzevii IFO 1802]CAI4061694.1 hypothetical protein SKDI_07G1420 [Saccharomyces kudriavzevii IFO 1802]
MKPVSIRDLETDQGKIHLVNTLKDVVCKALLESVDIQIESFMYPNDPKQFIRIFKNNKMSHKTSDRDPRVKNYPLSLGIGHSALLPLVYIRQKTNSLRSLNELKRSPTELVNELKMKFKSINEAYSGLHELCRSYLAVYYSNIGHQKILGDIITQSGFMLDIFHRFATITSSVAQEEGEASTLVSTANQLIEDINLFYKRIINNSNAYTEYHLIKHGINRNQSEETLVELEFKTMDVSGMRLDDEFDAFLQHRKASLRIIYRRVI